MKIAFLGDMALYGKYSHANPEVYAYLKDVKSYLSGFDFVIGNLETPFVGDERPLGGKSASIKSDAADVDILKYLGIKAVNLANNHSYDFGWSALKKTMNLLERNGIEHFGIDDKPFLLVCGENKVAMHGYCSFNTNPLGIKSRYGSGVSGLNVENVISTMRTYREKGYFNVISVHTGQEHVNYPSVDDVKMARLLSKFGPYVYYGHHPHVVQGVEECNGSYIAYSLGNFMFDDVYTDKSERPLIAQTDNNKTGLIWEIEFSGNSVVSHKPTLIYSDIQKLKVLGDDASKSYADLFGYSEKLRDVERNVNGYVQHRDSVVHSYINLRKKNRDVEWYIKRININSLRIIVNSKLNAFRYKNSVARYLAEYSRIE